VRLEELRSFMRELVLESSLRPAAKRVGLGHEALRKFIIGETDRPHERSRRAMGQLYLERKRLSVAEGEAAPSAGQLKLLLPRGLEKASAEISAVFEVFRGMSRPPALAADLERWLLRRLQAEYAREVPYPTASRRRREKAPPDEAAPKK
jgi:hypothetical protein